MVHYLYEKANWLKEMLMEDRNAAVDFKKFVQVSVSGKFMETQKKSKFDSDSKLINSAKRNSKAIIERVKIQIGLGILNREIFLDVLDERTSILRLLRS